jgi:hypothetical protein
MFVVPDVSFYGIRGEHKNTLWFQVVIKSKLTGILLQNWWLQLHKLIQFHVVSHTLNVPHLLFLGKHRCDNLAGIGLCSELTAAVMRSCNSSTVAGSGGTVHRLCPSRTPKGKSHKRSGPVISGATCIWSQMHPLSMKFLPLQNGLVSRRIHIKFEFESTLHSHNTVLWNSSTHQLRCCEVSAILLFTAIWRRAGKLKILELIYLQSHIYKSIPVSFDFITTWNQGRFLCSSCIFCIFLCLVIC